MCLGLYNPFTPRAPNLRPRHQAHSFVKILRPSLPMIQENPVVSKNRIVESGSFNRNTLVELIVDSVNDCPDKTSVVYRGRSASI